MNYCQRCILPDTRPGLVLDADGVCNACRYAWRKQHEIDWEQRKSEFRQLVKATQLRQGRYDCIIPVSGGKDSHWQVVTCLEEGLHPLTVTWRPPLRTAVGQQNLENLKRLGVDHIDFSVNSAVQKRFMRAAFEKVGTPFVPMHLAMDALARTAAHGYGAPLIIWGENSADEYGTSNQSLSGAALQSAWMKTFNTRGTTAEDWVSEELTREDLAPYFPAYAAAAAGKPAQPIFLGYYFRWDPENSRAVAFSHGFRSGPAAPLTGYYQFADLDDALLAVHHWVKWYKFGLTRMFDNLSLEIRFERKTRAEAIEIIRARGDETPHEAIDLLCEYVGITRERFAEIAETFRNQAIWQSVGGTWRMPEFLIKDWVWNESQSEKTPAAV